MLHLALGPSSLLGNQSLSTINFKESLHPTPILGMPKRQVPSTSLGGGALKRFDLVVWARCSTPAVELLPQTPLLCNHLCMVSYFRPGQARVLMLMVPRVGSMMVDVLQLHGVLDRSTRGDSRRAGRAEPGRGVPPWSGGVGEPNTTQRLRRKLSRSCVPLRGESQNVHRGLLLFWHTWSVWDVFKRWRANVDK